MNTREALVKNSIKQEMTDLYKIRLHVGLYTETCSKADTDCRNTSVSLDF